LKSVQITVISDILGLHILMFRYIGLKLFSWVFTAEAESNSWMLIHPDTEIGELPPHNPAHYNDAFGVMRLIIKFTIRRKFPLASG
jgi:hypothetical protein